MGKIRGNETGHHHPPDQGDSPTGSKLRLGNHAGGPAGTTPQDSVPDDSPEPAMGGTDATLSTGINGRVPNPQRGNPTPEGNTNADTPKIPCNGTTHESPGNQGHHSRNTAGIF